MKISRQKQITDSKNWLGWHILTVAEAGFSMLDIYGRDMYDIDIAVIRRFADTVNQRGESGSLHPNAPISAIPRRFFRDIPKNKISKHLNEFQIHIKEFIQANASKIHARKILIDFHVSPEPVPDLYLSATEQAFHKYSNPNDIDEIIRLE